MEQTVNTWNKGLQMDTHPMVLSNDTLSDALNATFVTMNGNEVILLNDMGNRRVDNAFLPPGYLPVGIKEYGGIIYVAAYNPITDKSQIGSFPSPERRINDLDDSNLGGSFDFNIFLDSQGDNVSFDTYLGLNVIHNDSFMVPLTGDTSLRAGDKFAIYSYGNNGLYNYKDEISNYGNIDGISQDYRAKTPKNRKYTLQVGILNSQNEFVDITKSLCRWEVHRYDGVDHWSPVTFNQEVSDIYKFNYGYFIADGFTNPQLEETIRDLNLIRERQKIAANTYAYKLVGPLYLKVIFNHIENFNYNIYGIKSGSNTKLWIEAYITYNCPDNSYRRWYDLGNEYYTDLGTGAGFEHGIEDFPVFDFYDSSDMTTSLTPVDGGKNTISNISYNQNSNLYSAKITKEYLIRGLTEGIFEYVIGVLADCKTPDIYLKGLCVKNSIDLSLLGTGLAKINGWRFYNNLEKETTTLTVSFDAYPEYGKHFGGLYFEFAPAKEDSNGDIVFDWNSAIRYPENGELPLYNGRQTFNFSWNKRFKPRTLYAVTTYYSVYDDITGEELSTNLIDSVYNPDAGDYSNYRWFLSTELFNEFYQPSAGIDDFCNLGTINGYVPIRSVISEGATRPAVQEAFENKMIVSLETSNRISNDSVKADDIFEGDLTSKTATIEYTCKHQYNVNINSSSEIKIINEDLYPDFIFVKPEKKNKVQIIGYSVTEIGDEVITDVSNKTYNEIFKELLSINEGDGITSDLNVSRFKDLDELRISLNASTNNLSGTIEYWDRYKGYNANGISNVENVFDSLFNGLFSESVGPISNYYAGIFVNFDSRRNHDDGHFVDVYNNQANNNPLSGGNYPSNSTLRTGGMRVYENWHDGTIETSVKSLKDLIYPYFNTGLFPGQMFIYMFLPAGHNYTNSRDVGSGISGLNGARVWWRASDSEWALFDTLYPANNNFRTYLETLFGNKDRIYCMYDQYPGTISSIHATDNNRIFYNNYSIPITIIIDYDIDSNTVVGDILSGLGEINGTNLWFLGNPKMPNINPSVAKFKLESSKVFLDKVNSFRVDSIKNIDLVTGLRYDSEGKELNRNYTYTKVITGYKESDIPKKDETWQIVRSYDGVASNGAKLINWEIKKSTYEATPDFSTTGIYNENINTQIKTYYLLYYKPYGGGADVPKTDPWYYLNNCTVISTTLSNTTISRQAPGSGYNLVKEKNNYIKLDSDNKINTANGEKNTIVYNRKDTIGTPQYRFDHCGDDNDDHTILDYALTNIVRLT